MSKRAWWVGLALVALMVLSWGWTLSVGAIPIPFPKVLSALMGRAGEEADTFHTIIWELRLPRVLLASVVGGALGLVGCAFQGLLRNPLADPYIVGVSSGAAVGAALSVLLGWHTIGYGWGSAGLAFISGLLVLTVVIALSQRNGHLHLTQFLLTGVAVGTSLWGIVTLLLVLAGEDLSRVLYWLLGGLLNADWQRLEWCALLMLIGGVALFSQARALNLYCAGETVAQHLGVQVERLKWVVLVAGSLTTAGTVAVAGIIGFVGWLVPHLLRLLVGGDHRVLMPLSALGGALLLLWADTIARTLARPTELPVGVITALVGTPLFLWVMRQQKTGE